MHRGHIYHGMQETERVEHNHSLLQAHTHIHILSYTITLTRERSLSQSLLKHVGSNRVSLIKQLPSSAERSTVGSFIETSEVVVYGKYNCCVLLYLWMCLLAWVCFHVFRALSFVYFSGKPPKEREFCLKRFVLGFSSSDLVFFENTPTFCKWFLFVFCTG